MANFGFLKIKPQFSTFVELEDTQKPCAVGAELQSVDAEAF